MLLHQKANHCSDIKTSESRLRSRFIISHYCAVNVTCSWSSDVATLTNLTGLCPCIKVDMKPSETHHTPLSADVYLLTLSPKRLVAGIFKPVHYCTAPCFSSVFHCTLNTRSLPHTNAPTHLRQLQRLRIEKSNLWVNGVYCSLVKLSVSEHDIECTCNVTFWRVGATIVTVGEATMRCVYCWPKGYCHNNIKYCVSHRNAFMANLCRWVFTYGARYLCYILSKISRLSADFHGSLQYLISRKSISVSRADTCGQTDGRTWRS